MGDLGLFVKYLPIQPRLTGFSMNISLKKVRSDAALQSSIAGFTGATALSVVNTRNANQRDRAVNHDMARAVEASIEEAFGKGAV
jgi:hypothetical protein